MLSEEKLTELFRYSFSLIDSRMTPNQQAFCRAIESAATAPLLARIAELERHNNELVKRREFDVRDIKDSTAKLGALERELEEARKDAERLDYIQKNARNDPKMDGNHVWWPTTFNKALKGPTIRAAIDAARAAIKEQT